MLYWMAMSSLSAILPYIEIILAIVLVVVILMQRSEAGVGGSFGGNDNFAAGFHTRRGFEKNLFYFTIIIGVLFVVSSLLLVIR